MILTLAPAIPHKEGILAWFRYHTDALDNPKIQTLPALLFRFWVNLLCVSKKVDGFLPETSEISFRCRVPEKQVEEWLAELKRRKLIDQTADGELFMHDWNEHQFVSDDVTARVRKHRAKRKGNVSVTPPEQSRADNRADNRADAPPATAILHGEFPLAAGALRERFPDVDDAFVMRLTIAIGQKVAGLNGKIKGAPDDRIIAKAIRYCTKSSPKQNSAGLYLKTVPRCVASWLENGEPGDPTQNPIFRPEDYGIPNN